MILRSLNSQTLFYAALGFFIVVPLLASWISGVNRFTLTLRLVQKFALGILCLLFAVLPGMYFTYDHGNPAPEWSGRVVFGVMALLMVGTGLRTLLRWRKGLPWEDFDNQTD
ncbi:hypothetical protein [Silvibacterium acidisoli]|uniref:hypothetical protein n=1 Tax=Acidobacteriaceae bacterium ZG23-2 TaxID=2883246 RepID=UPI00406D04D0